MDFDHFYIIMAQINADGDRFAKRDGISESGFKTTQAPGRRVRVIVFIGFFIVAAYQLERPSSQLVSVTKLALSLPSTAM